ncbi:MAG TPA: glycosyltransferase family 4 protein, partial [Thermoanaerobaculia bacterium]|nr:glycosyltransferase family 4 protein [Thermoanaerobaculia bacterium]
KGGPLTWRATAGRWEHVTSFSELDASPFDFVVGTFWTTLEDAYALAGNRAVHLCQGYEGSFTGYQSLKPQIDAAYSLPIPKITVSPHLVPICRRFFDDATAVGQIVDDEFFQLHPRVDRRPRVVLVGPAQADFKGIDLGYEAVRIARETGAVFDLIRVSQWVPAAEEPTELAAEFHVGIDTRSMAAIFASADVFLGPSRQEEGFGLPAAEAMAGGVPAVLSEIPSFLSWSERRDYALFAPEGDSRTMAAQLIRLLDDIDLREQVALRGRSVAEQFRAAVTGRRVEEWFQSRVRTTARTRRSGR